MKGEQDHWRLYPYLRTPLVDVGTGAGVSHMAMRMPEEYLAHWRDGALGTICADRIEVPNAAREIVKRVRHGGHVIARDITPDAIKAMGGVAQIRWGIVHGFTVVQRLSGKNGVEPLRTNYEPTNGQKTVCIVRYGAIGDHLMATPLVQHYHENGYHITYNCTEKGQEVWKGDPRINRLMVQESNIVPPNEEIKKFWEELSKDYDEFVNLSEVVEGDLLRIEGRPEFNDSWEKRQIDCNKNYIDHHFHRAGLDVKGKHPSVYLSEKEKEYARKVVDDAKRKTGKSKAVLFNVMGSSFHKIYPWTFDVWTRSRYHKDDVVFIAVGDMLSNFYVGKEFDDVCVNLCGRTPIRFAIALHSEVDAVITPETWSLIAGFAFDAPIVALLSHSSKGNYNWREQDRPLHTSYKDCPCYPCHQLHYSRRSCPQGVIEPKATKCMDQLAPDTVYDALMEVLNGNDS